MFICSFTPPSTSTIAGPEHLQGPWEKKQIAKGETIWTHLIDAGKGQDADVAKSHHQLTFGSPRVQELSMRSSRVHRSGGFEETTSPSSKQAMTIMAVDPHRGREALGRMG